MVDMRIRTLLLLYIGCYAGAKNLYDVPNSKVRELDETDLRLLADSGTKTILVFYAPVRIVDIVYNVLYASSNMSLNCSGVVIASDLPRLI